MKLYFKKTTIGIMLLSVIFLLVVTLFVLPFGVAPNVVGSNYKNVTVQTFVNITNAKPEVLNVTIYESANFSLRNITVNAGSFKTIFCNATVRDWNGFNDIVYVNASLWHMFTSFSDSSDDNNTHYTNSSCVLNSSISSTVGFYVCSFDVWYYSNNGTWACNVSTLDTLNKTGSGFNTTIFYPVYSLNVTDGVNFGNVAVEDYSLDVDANVTNLGNMAINLSVEGYGSRRGDGLAMNCSLSGNITVSNERFALSSGVAFGSKTSLASTSVLVSDLTMPKQTLHNTYIVNSTYWQLYIPPNPAGNCTGYVIFTALAP
ncbi:MAG: hypothetical protein ACP5N1_00015 [Candidatus Woesearchaeota archaeon]